MKRVRTLLVAAMALGGLAACDTMNDFHDSVRVNETHTKDVYFSGIHGKSQTFCGPQQRHNRTCY